MASKSCPACGESALKPFKSKSFVVRHGGQRVEVKGLSGWRCGKCDEIIFNAASARRYAAAGDKLVLSVRERDRIEIRRIRRKLGLSQAGAARLTGGGHNAFSRYERGEARPLPAVVNLFKLLDKHPELLQELKRD
jgi:HTH-type transcriptional regulator / antitoxin MqsA